MTTEERIRQRIAELAAAEQETVQRLIAIRTAKGELEALLIEETVGEEA